MRDVFSEEKEIYRDPYRKKLGGVCAGVANYMDIPRFYVRMAALAALVLIPQVTLIAYGLAYLILDEDPRI